MLSEDFRQRLDEVVLQAASLAKSERSAYFADLAETDPDVLAEAQRLLAEASTLPSSFLAVPAGDLLTTLTGVTEDEPDEADDEDPAPLTSEERYEIKEILGQGGMARVYRAWDKQLHRWVALKFLDHPNAAMRRRLVREARSQARVRHRHVLEVYETGERDGTPYIAMRYVEGGTLADLGDEVSLEEKVSLLARVADALHAAHREGLLHRDVKPSNVLVEEAPDHGLEPWVTDFGIAVRDRGETSTGSQYAGTPYFLPPERLTAGAEIDRRADIYSLGVTMYQIFSGELPYAGTELLDILQKIHTEAPRPIGEVAPSLPTELAAIVTKCLARQPSDRYPSARAVAEDLRRYLEGEVVEAYTASLSHRVGKFVVRHRHLLAVAGIGAVLLVVVLAAFAVMTSMQSRQIARKAESLERVSSFLIEMFELADPYGAADPDQSRGEDMTVREALDRARDRLQTDRELIGEPEIRARLMDSLGMVYRGLTLYEPAEPLLREALALRREALPPDHLDVAQSLFTVGTLAAEKGELADWQEAEALLRESLEIRRRALGDEHLDVAAILKRLAFLDHEKGDYEGAERLYQESLGMYERLLGPQHIEVAEVLNNFGVMLLAKGDFARAEPLFRQSLAIRKSLVGDRHALVLESLVNLGEALRSLRNFREAETLFRESLALHRQLLGDRHVAVASNLHSLAGLLRDQGKLPEAESAYRETLEIVTDLLGDRHVVVPIVMANLASVLAIHDQAEEAEDLSQRAVRTFREILPEGHWRTAYARGIVGASLAGLGRYGEAEELLQSALAAVGEQQGEDSPGSRYLLERLIGLYEAWDRPEKAAEYRDLMAKDLGESAPS